VILDIRLRIPFVPVFPGQSRFMDFKNLCHGAPAIFCSGCQNVRVSTSFEDMILLTLRTDILNCWHCVLTFWIADSAYWHFELLTLRTDILHYWHCVLIFWITDTAYWHFELLTLSTDILNCWHCVLTFCLADTACWHFELLTLRTDILNYWHCYWYFELLTLRTDILSSPRREKNLSSSGTAISRLLTGRKRRKWGRYVDWWLYRGVDKSLARPGRKQATATEDFDFCISYL
jgi:hypothetical protein